MSRFAPITASLLARKGDAMPSTMAAKPTLMWSREAAPPPPPVADEPPPMPVPRSAEPPPPPGKGHRMVLTLSAPEFERLGIAAVKKEMTRHQIVRAALDIHLDRLKREYGACGCIAGSCVEGCRT
ncbi:MAG: hypothetical protein JO294_02705 [Alphaproteobacteria bacterium]|nr:hypothetical protein [Alphaproteobacteria bacterium]MBV9905784.1 hypothetical protein [Alphaproteobacteria bacterium]